MRQQLSTLLIVITLMTMMSETFMTYLQLIDGLPLLRLICFFILAIYVMQNGELNRREYEAKRKKINRLKAERKQKSFMEEYEAFRKEMHG